MQVSGCPPFQITADVAKLAQQLKDERDKVELLAGPEFIRGCGAKEAARRRWRRACERVVYGAKR